jgi:hypothetical protein
MKKTAVKTATKTTARRPRAKRRTKKTDGLARRTRRRVRAQRTAKLDVADHLFKNVLNAIFQLTMEVNPPAKLDTAHTAVAMSEVVRDLSNVLTTTARVTKKRG